jgi:hypothetical protein
MCDGKQRAAKDIGSYANLPKQAVAREVKGKTLQRQGEIWAKTRCT